MIRKTFSVVLKIDYLSYLSSLSELVLGLTVLTATTTTKTGAHALKLPSRLASI